MDLGLGILAPLPAISNTRAPTREDGPFHNLKPEYARNSLDNGLRSGLITDEDARLIEEYVAEIRATEGIGLSRSNKITFSLIR
jgi:hypothetical protein